MENERGDGQKTRRWGKGERRRGEGKRRKKKREKRKEIMAMQWNELENGMNGGRRGEDRGGRK